MSARKPRRCAHGAAVDPRSRYGGGCSGRRRAAGAVCDPAGRRPPSADHPHHQCRRRTDTPLLSATTSRPAPMNWCSRWAIYFRAGGAKVSDPPFLDLIPLRFTSPARALPRAAAVLPVELFHLSRLLRPHDPHPDTAAYPRDMVGYGRTPPHPRCRGRRASACSSSSITRKAGSAPCCMGTANPKPSSPRSRCRALAGPASHEHGVAV